MVINYSKEEKINFMNKRPILFIKRRWMKDTNKFYLECECGSHAVVFEQFIDDGAVNISYKVDVFTYKQEGIFRKLFRRVELSLNILFGGEALLYDIYIGEQKLLDELKMFIQGMENIKENVN